MKPLWLTLGLVTVLTATQLGIAQTQTAAPPTESKVPTETKAPPAPANTAAPAPRANTAIIPSLNRGFMGRHNGFVEIAKKGDIDLLFMGDSITDFWRSSNAPFAGKAVFDKNFGSIKTANFGIAGDTTQGVLWRLQHGEGEGFKPKAVMLMIGTNNTGRHTAQEIAMGVAAVVGELRKDFPDAKILLLGIFPRGRPDTPARTKIAEINKIISALHDEQHVFYLDINSKFLAEDGSIPRDVMSDALHPTTKGYELWAEAVKEPLENLLKETPPKDDSAPPTAK